jgi:transcriptional regulator with XRE-family HTH domain
VKISPSFLSLLERDKREPTVGVLRAIGSALKVPPGVLVAAALAEEGAEASSSASRKISLAIDHLVKAAYHLVLSERMDRPALSKTRVQRNVRTR